MFRSQLSSSFALALLSYLAAPHQLLACQPGDANTFCAHADTPSVPGVSTVNGELGHALALGDFDGNGVLDLAVGAPGQGTGATGTVVIFYSYGKAITITGVQNISGSGAAGGFGYSLATGDLDGDGFDDLAVGQPFRDLQDLFGNCIGTTCSEVGQVVLYYGSADGLVSTQPITLDPVTENWTFDAHFGFAVAIGKLTNSGLPVVAIGVPGAPSPNAIGRTGRVEIYQAPNFASVPQFVESLQVAFPATEDGGDEQGAALVVGRFDQLPDRQLVVGAPGANPAGVGNAGLIEVANYDGVDFASLAPFEQTDFGLAGNASDSRFGASLAVGDFDGEGHLDLAIGAPDRDLDGQDKAGRVYIGFGSATGLRPDLKFRILQESSYSGQTIDNDERFGAALAGGDFDGDGFDDLAIGAPGEGSTDTGFVYLAWGGTANGLDPVPSKGINFSQLFLGGSNGADDRFGAALAAGDLEQQANGLGTDEIVIGAPGKTIGGDADAGMVYLTRELDPAWIFGDGFESAGTTVWSTTVP